MQTQTQTTQMDAAEAGTYNIFASTVNAGMSVAEMQADVVKRLIETFGFENEDSVKSWVNGQGPIDALEKTEFVGRGDSGYVFASNPAGAGNIAIFKESLELATGYFEAKSGLMG